MKITIEFDPETQAAKAEWDPEFKTFDMVLAVLEMAKSAVEFQRQMARMQQAAEVQMQQMQAAALKGQILGNGGLRR